MFNPLVSIVILNFNRLEELRETILKTDDTYYNNLEIIIVDNGSCDGSHEFIKSLDQSKYNTILLSENLGSAVGHNEGMKAAQGEFIITIDDDCFLHPMVVAKTVEIFQANNNLAAIGFGFVNPYTDFDKKKYEQHIDFKVHSAVYNDVSDSLLYTSAAAFRKTALEKVGYIDECWFYVTEDIELNFNLIAHGYSTVTIPQLIAYHKSAPSNRNFDQITYNGIQGTVWIICKYYPWYIIPKKLLRIIHLSITFSILNRKLIYIKALIGALKKIPHMITNPVRLKNKICKQISLPDLLLFSR